MLSWVGLELTVSRVGFSLSHRLTTRDNNIGVRYLCIRDRTRNVGFSRMTSGNYDILSNARKSPHTMMYIVQNRSKAIQRIINYPILLNSTLWGSTTATLPQTTRPITKRIPSQSPPLPTATQRLGATAKPTTPSQQTGQSSPASAALAAYRPPLEVQTSPSLILLLATVPS